MSEEPFQSGGIAGVLHGPEQPTGAALALTHGAGSDHRAPMLRAVATALAEAGILTLRYDLPYRRDRAKGPPYPAGAARDRAGVAEAVGILRAMAAGPIFAGGHSYGGRQTAMAAAESQQLADGLLLFSYPLHPPGQPQRMRTTFFGALRTPTLFVSGTRDPFGSMQELRSAVVTVPTRTEILAVEGAGHDLRPLLRDAAEVVRAFQAFFSLNAP